MQTEKDYVKDLGIVVEVSWSKPCYAKCFPTKKHHADKWQQQKIQHEKQTALFCSLLPWSPSHVDRNKKKCLWKLFLFPSSKCCILGSTPVCKGFSWLPYLWQTLFAVMQLWRHWWRINLWAYQLFHAFLPVILGNGNTYFTWICSWIYVLCLSTFSEAGPGIALRCMFGLWIIVLQKSLR